MRLGGFATEARLITFHGLVDGREHLAIGLGEPGRVPLVRPHSECLTGDVLGSERCDCGPQLKEAVARITAAGVMFWLRLKTFCPSYAAFTRCRRARVSPYAVSSASTSSASMKLT
jgi:GTP cyclohydrolase II